MKKIMIIWQGDWPWDIRINKQVSSLQKFFEVHLLCRNTQNLKLKEILNGLHVHRFYNLIPFNQKISNLLSKPFYINPFWFLFLLFKLITIKPNLVIVRDIPIAPSAIWLCKILKIKVILDMAEHYPALVKSNTKYISNFCGKYLFLKFDWYTKIEKYSVENADAIFVVIEEQKNRLLNSYKIKNNISVVSNTPVVANIITADKNFNNNGLNIVYTGNIDGDFRGIKDLVIAANILRTHSNIQFNIIGNGQSYNDIVEYVKENNLKNINLMGRKSHEYLINFIKTQDVGIVPHTKSDVVEYTIPNKLFDYMLNSLPVITSSARPLKRIVEETNCGYVYEACNPKSLAECINYILNHKSELYNKAQNGYEAVKSKYNWENDSKVMMNVINKCWEENNDFKN